jgi:hypothetical protein
MMGLLMSMKEILERELAGESEVLAESRAIQGEQEILPSSFDEYLK